MHSIWLQSQMCDLIILHKNPDIIPEFIQNPSQIPRLMVIERAKYWQKNFHAIKQEFTKEFEISDRHKNDLDAVFHIRNAIAHSHVSIARSYLLYRPDGGENKEKQIISTLGISSIRNQSDPTMFALRFNGNDKYMKDFNRINRLDKECFKCIAEYVGIPQSRIR